MYYWRSFLIETFIYEKNKSMAKRNCLFEFHWISKITITLFIGIHFCHWYLKRICFPLECLPSLWFLEVSHNCVYVSRSWLENLTWRTLHYPGIYLYDHISIMSLLIFLLIFQRDSVCNYVRLLEENIDLCYEHQFFLYSRKHPLSFLKLKILTILYVSLPDSY